MSIRTDNFRAAMALLNTRVVDCYERYAVTDNESLVGDETYTFWGFCDIEDSWIPCFTVITYEEALQHAISLVFDHDTELSANSN